MSVQALATSSKAMKRGKAPRVGKTQPCRRGARSVRYCKLMRATLDHARHVGILIQFTTGAAIVAYERTKKDPALVWSHCPYCGEPIIPTKARA